MAWQSFDLKTRHRNIQLRWTITRWISVRCHQYLRINEDYYVDYWRCKRKVPGADWWRYSLASFDIWNLTCLHIKINNFIETRSFFAILSFYYCIWVCLTSSKFLHPKTKRKGFNFGFSWSISSFVKKIHSDFFVLWMGYNTRHSSGNNKIEWRRW